MAESPRKEYKEESTNGTCYDREDANFSEGDQNQCLQKNG
jgi:hypothetical protein